MTLAMVWETPDERRALAEWREAGLQVIAASLTKRRSLLNMLRMLSTTRPLQAMYCWHPELWAQIRECLAVDAVILAFAGRGVPALAGTYAGLKSRGALAPRRLR